MRKKGIGLAALTIVLLLMVMGWTQLGKNQKQSAEPDREEEQAGKPAEVAEDGVQNSEPAGKEAGADKEPAGEMTEPVTEVPAEADELLKEAAEKDSDKGDEPALEEEADRLRFHSREEAMQFVFSRFSAEEVELYNKAAAGGLTAEQQEMALQIAYSRFSDEEIAAVEAAIK